MDGPGGGQIEHGALEPFEGAGGKAERAGDGRAGVRDKLQPPGPVGLEFAELEALPRGREQQSPDVPHKPTRIVRGGRGGQTGAEEGSGVERRNPQAQ